MKIFNVVARAGIPRVFGPLAGWLLRRHVTPDMVTVAGTVITLIGTIGFAARGQLLIATLIVIVGSFTDVIDGTMARMSGRQGKFGAFLDSTLDRVADGAIFASTGYWLMTQGRHAAAAASFICLVAGQVVSYAKARAEGLGMTANVGVAERAERLIIIGLGGLLAQLVWTYTIDISVWILAVLSLITVGQRIVTVYRQDRAAVLESEASRSVR
ncbi:phosphatidylinositol phosphate synthase [Rugosimonospora africana]|uniref:Phosphatidylinositol phosphate synthase n=1 Tax=Rugosimonospora africana TaxID=556532 RepID=A0A8J3QWJ7_9ACTN|nr:CDP-alcohol phosphatidyltransferase family protein [Rugosimonospora africana]GIH17377.1 CDP-alcohol phosphatidyltransferase [Rugosimonospora africana]